MFRILTIKYFYTIEPLMNVRSLVSSKICYKPSLSFLKNKGSLTQSLSNRIVVNSNYQRSYRDLRGYYILSLRANFTPVINLNMSSYFFKDLDNKKFLLFYSKTRLTRELDYTLHWRGSQINSLFNIATTVTKKKKKLQFKHRTFFISSNKRLLFVWRWLSVFIRGAQVRGISRRLSLIRTIENFLMASEDNHAIFDFKLQIYKLYMMRIT